MDEIKGGTAFMAFTCQMMSFKKFMPGMHAN